MFLYRWAIWLLAGAGVIYQQMFHERYKWLETLIYLVIAIAPSLCIYEMVSYSALSSAVACNGIQLIRCSENCIFQLEC